MNEFRIQVTGLKELGAACKKVDTGLPKEVAKINGEAAAALVPAARALAPKLTGRLAGSIRASATARAGVVRAGSASVPYAGPIHWGWPRHHISPHPFLVDALQDNVDKIVAKYDDDLQRFLDHWFG